MEILAVARHILYAKGRTHAHFTDRLHNLFPSTGKICCYIFTTNLVMVLEGKLRNEHVLMTQVDQSPTLLHVFLAGNQGTAKPSAGMYRDLGFANLTGNFKQAKNVLIVSAVDSTMTVNSLNSRGPAYDGRVKPELVAHGQGGTSEAAAPRFRDRGPGLGKYVDVFRTQMPHY